MNRLASRDKGEGRIVRDEVKPKLAAEIERKHECLTRALQRTRASPIDALFLCARPLPVRGISPRRTRGCQGDQNDRSRAASVCLPKHGFLRTTSDCRFVHKEQRTRFQRRISPVTEKTPQSATGLRLAESANG